MVTINFFGTNDFGAGILEALLQAPDFKIETVITAPDRPAGRHHLPQKSKVKQLAETYGLNIEQPATLTTPYPLLRKEGATDKYSSPVPHPPSLNVVCDYGLIIPKNILETPEHDSINIHPSLLPKYRGASPIQSALINGDAKTGVTIMLMDEKMDHGPILAQKEVEIDKDDTYTTLAVKLLKTAKLLAVDTIRKWVLWPKMTPQAQDEAKAVYCREFKRDDGQIDWTKPAAEIYNLWRGLTPWPGVWTTLKNKRLKIILIQLDKQGKQIKQGKPGEIIINNNQIFFVCGDGNLIEALELQIEGKRAMTAKEFLAGNRGVDGTRLSS